MLAMIMLLGAMLFSSAAYHNEEHQVPLLGMALACAVAGISSILW